MLDLSNIYAASGPTITQPTPQTVAPQVVQFQFNPTKPTQPNDLGLGDGTPIVRTLPQSLTSLSAKYSDPQFQQALKAVPKDVAAAVKEQDRQRVLRGQMPETLDSTIKQMRAATTKNATTPATQRDRSANPLSIPGNAVKDIKEVVKAIPHMPQAIAGELKSVVKGDWAGEYRKLLADGQNPIQAFLNLPLIRMVPGAYIAQNVASGNIADIAEHPVYNLLDALPFASKAAKGTKVFKAMESEALAAITEHGSGRVPKPIPSALFNKLAEGAEGAESAVVRNRAGQLVDQVKAFTPIQHISDRMGRDARDVSRIVEAQTQRFKDIMEGKAVPDEMSIISGIQDDLRRFSQLSRDDDFLLAEHGIDRAREVELTKAMQREGLDVASLPVNEQAYLTEVRGMSNRLGRFLVDNDLDLGEFRGEFYPKQIADRLIKGETEVEAALIRVNGGSRITQSGSVRQVKSLHSRWLALAEVDDKFWDAAVLWREGNYREAAKILNRRQNYPLPRAVIEEPILDKFGAVTGVKRIPVTDKQVSRLVEAVKDVVGRQAKLDKTLRMSPPARFSEVVTQRALDTYIDTLRAKGAFISDEMVDEFLHTGYMSEIPGWSQKGWNKAHKAQARMWETIKAEGVDPVYIPRVSAKQAERSLSAGIVDRVPTIRAAKERIADFTPAVQSASIGLTDEGANIVNRVLTEETLTEIARVFGKAEPEIRAMYREQALAMAERDPLLSAFGHEQNLMMRDWRAFDPTSMGVFSSSHLAKSSKRIMLPRAVADTLEAIHKQSYNSLTRITDPATGLFRVSLLALSPRWHFYNIVGGAVMTLLETGPGAFKPSNIRQTVEVLKAIRSGEAVSTKIAKELQRTLGYTTREEMSLAFDQGRRVRELVENNPAARAGKSFVQFSYDLNQKFDDFYRTLGYLYGTDKALTKGMTVAQAQMEGLTVARKVLQDTAGMTPFERSVLRQIFPFYSWLSHVVRFTLQYPVDHPLRAAIMGGVADQVVENLGSGGNLSMLDRVTYGAPDENGMQKGLPVRAANPISDAGNLLTLSGWLGATNPFISTMLEQIGVDTQTGAAAMFPDQSYDPETGRMGVDGGNPLQRLAFNIVPQTQAVYRALGRDDEYNQLQVTNPGTARSLLASGVGLPVLNRGTSRPEQYMRAEKARQTARSDLMKAHLKTGNIKALREMGVSDEAIATLLAMQKSGQFNPANVANSGKGREGREGRKEQQPAR